MDASLTISRQLHDLNSVVRELVAIYTQTRNDYDACNNEFAQTS